MPRSIRKNFSDARACSKCGAWRRCGTASRTPAGLTVVVLTNLAQARPEQIADGVAAIYLPKNPPP